MSLRKNCSKLWGIINAGQLKINIVLRGLNKEIIIEKKIIKVWIDKRNNNIIINVNKNSLHY